MNNGNLRFIGIYPCPICKQTRRFYNHNRKEFLSRVMAFCEECRVVKVVCKDDKKYNVVGLINDCL